MDKNSDMLMVGYDYLHGDIPVLIVGRRLSNHTVDIVKAFQGTEAIELYNKLTIKGENMPNHDRYDNDILKQHL